jgi:hypothetical protein
MNIYLIIYLVLNVLGLGIIMAKHGEPKDGNYSFWRSLFSLGLELFLLYKAGLFN